MALWKVTRRAEPLNWGSFLLFGVALALSLGLGALMLMAQGKPALGGILLLLEGGFGHGYSLEDTLLKAIPIFLCAAGVAVCFRMHIWNIGAEGQFALGAIGATAVTIFFPEAPIWAMLPGMFLASLFAGAAWAYIPAVFRLYFHMNEIISSLMLNYIAVYILQFLVFGPWKDPGGSGMPMSPPFPAAAVVPLFFGRVHAGLWICVVIGLGLFVFFKYTRLGFELMVSGENPRTAYYAGMPYAFLFSFALCLCGALAGLAGAIEVSATVGKLQTSVLTGYGYTAIVVAWLSRLRTGRIALFAFLLAGLRVGVENMQSEIGIPATFGSMLEGSLLLTMLAVLFFENYHLSSTKAILSPSPQRKA